MDRQVSTEVLRECWRCLLGLVDIASDRSSKNNGSQRAEDKALFTQTLYACDFLWCLRSVCKSEKVSSTRWWRQQRSEGQNGSGTQSIGLSQAICYNYQSLLCEHSSIIICSIVIRNDYFIEWHTRIGWRRNIWWYRWHFKLLTKTLCYIYI